MTNSKAKQLISICAHLGNHKYNWNPETERFATGYRNAIIIFNISLTNFYINRALSFVEKLTKRFGRVYVYGLNGRNDTKLVKNFTKIGQVVAHTTWRGGFVSNAKLFKRAINNTRKKFSAAISLRYDYQNYSFPLECRNLRIPSICVVDSDVSPENFTYPIPINSKSYGGAKVLGFCFLSKVFKGISHRILTRYTIKIRLIEKGRGRKFYNKLYSKRTRKIAKRIIKIFKKNPIRRRRKKFHKNKRNFFQGRLLKLRKKFEKIFVRTRKGRPYKKDKALSGGKNKNVTFFKKIISRVRMKALLERILRNKTIRRIRDIRRKSRFRYQQGQTTYQRFGHKTDMTFSKIKENISKNGRRWNRTTTASFSGLYSTIELSP